jgi:hypothetical protein
MSIQVSTTRDKKPAADSDAGPSAPEDPWDIIFTERRPEFAFNYFDPESPVTTGMLADAIADKNSSDLLSTRDVIRAYNLNMTKRAVPKPAPSDNETLVEAYLNEILERRHQATASQFQPFFGAASTTKNFACSGDIVVVSGVTGDDRYLSRLTAVMLNALAETTRNVEIIVYGLDDVRTEAGAEKFAHMESALQDALLNARAPHDMYRPDGSIVSLPDFTLLPFPFHKYPAHVKDISNYAFKPLAVYEQSRKHKCVFWLDSSQEVLKLGQMVSELEKDGYWFAGGQAPFPTSYDWAYLNYWSIRESDFFGPNPENGMLEETTWGLAPAYYRRAPAPGFIGFNKGSLVSQSVLLCWVACVASKVCIDPAKFDFETDDRR